MEWEINRENMAHIQGIVPDLGKQIQEFVLGEVWARPDLDRKMRDLCTLAALSALGKGLPLEDTPLGAN